MLGYVVNDMENLEVDHGGHFHECDMSRIIDDIVYGFADLKKSVVLRLAKAINNGKTVSPVRLKDRSNTSCPHCGQRLGYSFDGKKLAVIGECPYPKGQPPYSIELNVPSGKMVVANDLRDGFPVLGSYNVNTIEGIKNTMLAYAKVGMAHGFVGNSCPGVYRAKKSKSEFAIGCNGKQGHPIKGARRIASVCTDLWWYSIVDYDKFVEHYGEEPDSQYYNIVKCEPGVYKFTHRHHIENNKDWNDTKVFTLIKRVRKPDPVVDYKGEYNKLNFTAGQIISEEIKRWPTLYKSDDKITGIMSAASHLLQNSSSHHPNGWVTSLPGLDSKKRGIKIPEFTKPTRWYPISDLSLLANAAGFYPSYRKQSSAPYLNESFTALAFNILQNILRYPAPEPNKQYSKEHQKSEKDRDKNNVKWAKKIIKKLAKRWPDRVPENCKDFV